MTEPKQLPENLADLKKTDSFKAVWSEHTIPELETLLDNMEVEHASTDDKAALVWRYMDAKGMAFVNDPETPADEPADATSGDAGTNDSDEPETPADEPADATSGDAGTENSNKNRGRISDRYDNTYAGFLRQALQKDTVRISITNNSPYAVFEPITRTYILARKQTVMRVSPSQQAAVESNLRQINQNRGGVLSIEVESK